MHVVAGSSSRAGAVVGALRWRKAAVGLSGLARYGGWAMAYVGVSLPSWPWFSGAFGLAGVGVWVAWPSPGTAPLHRAALR
ncbi:MAG: hypothetical protein ACRDY0_06900 [Acidimicrobiales bacterium]